MRLALVCSLLLAVHAALSMHSLRQHSPALDEGEHLLSGLAFARSGSLAGYRVNPPLVKVLAALPVALSNVRWTSRDQQGAPADQHRRFIAAQAGEYRSVLIHARMVIVLLSVVAGFLIYQWSAQLYGRRSGLIAAALWVFCPNVLAWNGLVTVDVGAATFALLAASGVRRYALSPSRQNALWAGVLLGVAQLAKFSLLVLYLVWATAWLAVRLRGAGRLADESSRAGHGDGPAVARRRSAKTPSATLSDALIVALTGIIVINCGYGFRATCRPVGEFAFRSAALTRIRETGTRARLIAMERAAGDYAAHNRFRGTWMESCPVPVPAEYIVGLDDQKAQADLGFPAYLRGQWRDRGWWYFYLYLLLVKLPTGTLLLAALAASLAFCRRECRARWLDELLVWLPPIVLIGLLSSQTGMGIHSGVRYILPALPFLMIGISRVGRVFAPAGPASAVGCAVILCLAANVVSVMSVHPHYVSYVNEVAGGTPDGWRHVLGTNTECGQDLFLLKRWLDDHHEVGTIGVACITGVAPNAMGIDSVLAPFGSGVAQPPGRSAQRSEAMGPQPGWYAVSIGARCGQKFSAFDESGGLIFVPSGAYTYFELFEPEYRIGYTIAVYHVSSNEAERVRRRFRGAVTIVGGHKE